MSAIKIIGKLNPKQYSEMLDHLTRKKIKNPFIDAEDIVVNKKPEVEQTEMFNRFNKANPRQDMAGGGMLVQPGFGGTRQGYAKDDVTYKGKYEADRYNTVKDIDSLKLKKEKINLKASDFRTGEMRYPDDKGQKYVQQYLDSVQKGYLNNDMSNVTRFKTFIKNKYPKTFAKVIADVNSSGYRGMMDIGVDYKRKLANEIITSSNNQLKYINQFDIIKKLVPQKRAVTVKNQGINTIGNLLDKDTLNAFRKLDTMEDKLSKSLTYIVNNNVEILDPSKIKIKGSAAAGYQTQSPIKKMMNYLAGGGSRLQLNKALEMNPWYQSQNYKVGKTTRNTFDDLSQAYSKDFIGQNFNDAYDYALNRRGSVSVKGMTKAITPERLIWNFAARSADRHFKDLEDPKDWLVKIVDNKGNSIDYSNLPVDDKGRRIIDTNKYQFLYEGQTFNKNNLSTKGYQSGLFNDVYKAANTITSYLNTDVPDPDNPKKTISLGKLFDKTDGRIFASIGHDDAKGGVKKKPFNTFKILTNVENQSLFNAYDKIKNPETRKKVVNFIYGETKGLRGDRYKEAWINKNVPLITEYIKTGQGLEQTPYKKAITMPPKKLEAEILKKMGFKCKFAASTGGAARCDDPASYTDDINKTRQDLKSEDVRVRANAQAKLTRGLDIAKTLPTVGKFLRRVGQATVGGVAKTLQFLGVTSPIGIAIEGAVEGGIYDYFKKQGYTDQQALSETFFPGMISGRPEGVPWYGGAESLLEKELTEGQPKVAQYVDALKDQEQVFDAFARKDIGQRAQRKDIVDAASADIQDLNRSGTISRINRIMNPESMASQAYQTAVERQAGRQDQRARDYKDRFYIQKEPSEFMQNQLQKERNEAMLQMFPPTTVEQVQSAYKAAGRGDELKDFEAEDYQNIMRDADIFNKQSYFADNFRLEKAGGGIAKLAGDRSGPPPERGPNSQGLQGLMKRVRNL